MNAATHFFSLIFLCMSAALPAQSIDFEKITIEKGLSQGMIYDLYQTRDGFLWIATKDGLTRYDGYNFKVFANNSFDSCTIAGNTATKLFEDSRNLFWVGLEGIGVDVYDPQLGHFQHLPLHFEPNKEAPFLRVQAIWEDKKGFIWVLYGKSKLVRIAIPARWKEQRDWVKQAEIAEIALEEWGKFKDDLVYFSVNDDGSLTLFTETRQFRLEAGSKTAKPVSNIQMPTRVRLVTFNARNSEKGWWLLDDLYRLYWLDDKGRLTVVQPQAQESKQQAYVETDSWGKSWLTLDSRIWQLDNPTQTIDLLKPDLILDRDATSIQFDQNGNTWVGTSGYGLRKINPDIQLFNRGAKGHSIWRLWRSPKGRYYCRKGLIKVFPYDPTTGLLSETFAFPELGDKGTRDICFEPSGAFWVLASHAEAGKQGGFLCRYDSSEALVQIYPFDFNGYDYARIFLDRDGYIWCTGSRCQLVRFDPRSEHFDFFDYSKLFGKAVETIQPLDIAQNGNGTIWIGTHTGLVKCNLNGKNPNFELLQTNPHNPNGLNHNSISCLLPDPARPDAVLWIGTKGGGINRLDLQNGRCQHLTTADGFPDQVVYGILPGHENPDNGTVALWCSTNRGLVKVMVQDKPTFSFDLVRYSSAQGLQGEEFNSQSFFKAANGELLFGGINGLNRFFPEKLLSDTVAPPVFIVGLEINHQAADKYSLATSLEHLKKIELAHNQNNLSIEFAALDFTDPSKNRYRYQLVGLDKNWVETGSHRFAHFSHLAPGKYKLRVQGSNGESGWREAQNLIVIVRPPWWRSDFAYLCYVLGLVWAGWRGYQFQIQRVKEREQLAFEHRETERVKALEQMKTNFFSNVTHEFRTPLTLMIEPLRQFLKNPNDPDGIEKVQLAEKNSRQLLSLVNQLLDMAKLESGQMSLDLRRADVVETVRGVFERFLPLAEKRKIKLVFPAPTTDLPEFNFDAGKVELILNNLISNALKFTPAGGRVEVNVGRVQNFANMETLEIRVEDSGIGIAREVLDKIFDRFYQVDGSHTRAGEGTGIGLALSKELAELIGGKISVESEVGKGSVFTFWLPVTSVGVTQSHPDTIQNSLPSSAVHRPPSAELPVALIIEDNPELRNFIKKSIREGWQVAEASDGEEGVKKALELLPDLVISDLMMPRKDGFEVVDELKNAELTAHIPVILLTAKSGIESRLAGLRRGADDYLTKPFSTEELLVRMENLLENRRRLRSIFGKQNLAADFADSPAPADEGEFLSVPDRDFLQKFTLLLDENLSDETLGVEDFARKMFVSRVQLHRKLKALTDRSATDFIRDFRLDRAHTMLRNREGRVGEVAQRVGFGNEKYFSTAFKEKFGVSPSQV